jgi:hypothetical protein
MTSRGIPRIRWAVLFVCAACVGCATEGRGATPPLPGVPGESDAVAGDDAGTAVEDGDATDDAVGAGGGTCDDGLHALKALFVLPPVPCAVSTDCPSGDCCYVNGSSSSCVMQ